MKNNQRYFEEKYGEMKNDKAERREKKKRLKMIVSGAKVKEILRLQKKRIKN